MGPNKGHSAGMHFNSTQLKMIGRQFCETLVDYVKDQDRVKDVYQELKVRYPQGGTSGAAGADFPMSFGSKDENKISEQ